MINKTENVIRYAQCCSAAFSFEAVAHILFTELGYTKVKLIENRETSTTAYLLSNNDETVLVFKASKEKQDWVTNFTFLLTPTINGKAHSGFLKAYQSVDKDIVQLLLHDDYKDKPLTLCGHSLGGALAQVGAYLLVEDFPIHMVCTFGSPRAFNRKAARSFDRMLDCLRFEIAGDAIARMPKPFMGYRHAGKHLFFDSSGAMHVEPSKSFQWYSNALDVVDEFLTGKWADWEDHKIALYIQRLKKWKSKTQRKEHLL